MTFSPALCRSPFAVQKPNCTAPMAKDIRSGRLTFMVDGKKHVQHIPKHLVEDVRKRVEAGREFPGCRPRSSVANAQLLSWRGSSAGFEACRDTAIPAPCGPVCQREAVLPLSGGWTITASDSRGGVAARPFGDAPVKGESFLAVEAWVRSPARRGMGVRQSFGDDALAYFTERLEVGRTAQWDCGVVKQAKRNKAFQDSRWIGLALDGTGAGRSEKNRCAGCRPVRNDKKEIVGHHHKFAMISVVGTVWSLPLDVEPYGPGDSEYAAVSGCCGGRLRIWGPGFRTTWCR